MIDTAYFLALFFIFIRLTAFFLVSKILFPEGTPAIVKAVLGMILSFTIVSGLDYKNLLDISSNYMLAYYLVSEVIVGVTFGFIINMIFEVVRMAGSYIDMQMGLSMMNVLDPASKTNSTIIANMTYFISVLIFFIVDGHHVLIRCLIKSFEVLPIGHSISFTSSFEVILDIIVKYFEIGFRIALPIVLILLITELCMSLVSRVVPQINVMILGMPVKICVGLLAFAAFLPIFVKLLLYSFDQIPDIFNQLFNTFSVAPAFFIFASDDKTEEPTAKKLSDAKRKGQIPRSKDVGLAAGMIACTLVLIIISGLIGTTMCDVLIDSLQEGILQDVTELSASTIMFNLIVKAAVCILPVVLPIMIISIAANVAQTGFLLTGEPLKPSLGKLNPISGFKNMFSKKSLADLVKNLLVVIIISLIAYLFIKENYDKILNIANVYLPSLGGELQSLIVKIFAEITLIMVILAIIDYVVQRRFFMKDMRMTKQEIKDEYKQMEGDPKVKGKIKQKQREMASRRMMESVADATVVITNPTHLAIAIKYEDGKMEAPKVVAKGADLIALKIKEVAKENEVPIMENKPLARMLFEQVEIDDEVPQEMYQAVAEILAMVFSLNNKK